MRTATNVQNLFAYEHLPEHLQGFSRPFYEMAMDVIPENGELTDVQQQFLWKLWEAKNLRVMAALQG